MYDKLLFDFDSIVRDFKSHINFGRIQGVHLCETFENFVSQFEMFDSLVLFSQNGRWFDTGHFVKLSFFFFNNYWLVTKGNFNDI
jgi:hypothetical protein